MFADKLREAKEGGPVWIQIEAYLFQSIKEIASHPDIQRTKTKNELLSLLANLQTSRISPDQTSNQKT